MMFLMFFLFVENGCSFLLLQLFNYLQLLKYLKFDDNNFEGLIGSDNIGILFVGLYKLEIFSFLKNFLYNLLILIFRDFSFLQMLMMKSNRIFGWNNGLFK